MRRIISCRFLLAALACLALTLIDGNRATSGSALVDQAKAKTKVEKKSIGKPAPPRDPELAKYAIFAKTAPRAAATKPVDTFVCSNRHCQTAR